MEGDWNTKVINKYGDSDGDSKHFKTGSDDPQQLKDYLLIHF